MTEPDNIIQQLIKQSYQEVPHEREWDATELIFNEQLFAQLLVKECANFIRSQATHWGTMTDETINHFITKSADSLEKHFSINK